MVGGENQGSEIKNPHGVLNIEKIAAQYGIFHSISREDHQEISRYIRERFVSARQPFCEEKLRLPPS
jgi:hypothetical protein